MNLGTEILSKIRDKAESMTIKEYEELFEDSRNLEKIDVVNIEISQSLFLKAPVYSDKVYDSFVTEFDIDIISPDSFITNYEKTDTYEMDEFFLMAA